ncbi:tyrosine-type recombinase/integrase [Nocardia nova]|uniref:tyrosine-type recombinase/integrase n=1 Tax=Nocardia nova TaxID=37330 RepID=UPI0033F68E3A
MPQERLEPGAYPPKHKVQPVRGDGGVWRIDRVRHRTFGGRYVRTSGSGYTKKECLADWQVNFERNRRKGSIIQPSEDAHPLQLTDSMSDAFRLYEKHLDRRVAAGKITQKTRDTYMQVVWVSHGPHANPDAIKLESEMGYLSIAEAGRPVFLNDYLIQVADFVPGAAGMQHLVLSGVFKMLTLMGLFDVSPMAVVPKPERASGGKQKALAIPDIDKLYKGLTYYPDDSCFRPFMLTLLGTGIRRGEGLALRWCDIDLRGGCAVIHVCGTIVKPNGPGKAFRQDYRKHGRGDERDYYLTLPQWLTFELRRWHTLCGEQTGETLIFLKRNRMVTLGMIDYELGQMRKVIGLSWLCCGHFRDTAATHITGVTGDPSRASAQLGHAEGSSVALKHYVDKSGYAKRAVDNAEAMESLKPSKLEQNWNPGPIRDPETLPTSIFAAEVA